MSNQQQRTAPADPYDNTLDFGVTSASSHIYQLPLPSQLLPSFHHEMQPPPTSLYSEKVSFGPTEFLDATNNTVEPHSDHLNFAKYANDVVNESLSRIPGGTSVVEPDSVFEDSGRLYHGYKEGTYLMPNDAVSDTVLTWIICPSDMQVKAEQDRLDLQHHVFLILLDDWLHLAPMTAVPKYVLDIGTGTGIWAHEFAERYPGSFVIGTDLSAIQPEPRVPNLVFQKDDAEAPWVFPAPHPPDANCVFPCEHRIKFDYVHLRLVVTCFNDTRSVIRQAFQNMNPGGWIEFQDASFEINAEVNYQGSPIQKYVDGCVRGAATVGRDLMKSKKYKQWLEEVGFVDVQERPLILPSSPWPKDHKLRQAGLYNLQNLIEGLRAIGWKMLKLAGHSPDEIESIVKDTETFLRDTRNQSYASIYIVYGRKP